jgi:N-acetylglutamate synthase-like GNAT family acetyltransferase
VAEARLPVSYRFAAREDQGVITAIILGAHLNPMNLRWANFLLAVDGVTGKVVGTGQIKTHRDGSRELASIATLPAYRGRGIAREIIRRLLAKNQGESADPLYLTCMNHLGTFYEQFGFRALRKSETPLYFRRLGMLARLLELFMGGRFLLVMRRDPPSGQAT